jgi:hypothetical protein
MEENKTQDTFFIYLQNFMDSLIEVFPENRKVFEDYLYYIQTKDQKEFITEFVKIMGKYSKQIMNSDESIFGKECYILRGINFSIYWNDKTLQENNKKTIWDYLKLLLFLGRSCNPEFINEEFTDMLDELKKIADTDENKTKEQPTGLDVNKLKEAGDKVKNLFGGSEDNFLASMVEDITNEISNELGDKKSINILELITGKNKSLEKIIENVKKHVDDKIAKGEIREEDITSSADKMTNILGSSDLQKNLFGGMDINQMMKNISPAQMKAMQDMMKGMMPKQQPRVNLAKQEKKRQQQDLLEKKRQEIQENKKK